MQSGLALSTAAIQIQIQIQILIQSEELEEVDKNVAAVEESKQKQ